MMTEITYIEYQLVREALPLQNERPRPEGPENYLVVGDPKIKNTWYLPVKRNGKPDHRLMGAAWSALTHPSGHRGNKYEGPGKAEATKKLRALYKSEGMPIPGGKRDVKD